MKQMLVVLVAVFFISTHSALSCDFCGCVMGINPYYNSNNKLMINVLSQHSTIDAISYSENRQTLEFGYQYHLADQAMVTVLMPYTFYDVRSGGSVDGRGIGDVSFLAHYVIDNRDQRNPTTLLLGAGVKIPTGNYTDTNIDLDTRLGSGSYDLLLNSMWIMTFGKWMWATDAFGKINSSNPEGGKLGNSLIVTTRMNTDIARNNVDHFAVVGNMGLRGETAGGNRGSSNDPVEEGVNAFYGTVGTQIVLGYIKLDITALIPLYQDRASDSPNESLRLAGGVRLEF